MCGFAGFFGTNPSEQPESVLHAMVDALQHRGLDDSGVWFDARAEIGFGHRRLAIVDLTLAGHQPMVSPCGRYVLPTRGRSTTPRSARGTGGRGWCVCVARAFGYRNAACRVAAPGKDALRLGNGMFAFALQDGCRGAGATWHFYLWDVLMFQAWHERWGGV